MYLLLLCAALTSAVPVDPNAGQTCGYESCTATDATVLNVHIVPHTHDDVGWLKTVDQYYYGSKNMIQKAGVQYILDSVVKELWEDPKRRFIYVETAFFWKWWIRQNEGIRRKVHTLVKEGRLQFVGGAWSMNDEAATHYQSTIDQFTWGLRKLNGTFGECGVPKVGWQIDPFGHSREFASLLAGMGYDGLFLGRIDFQDKAARLRMKNMEMIWRGDDDLGKSSDIFTGVLYNTYSPPPGFCFDVLCNDEPIIDDPSSPMFNVDTKINDFIKYISKQASYYRSNNVIVTMGGDFTYQDAAMWYSNLDKLIEYANLKAAKDGLKIKLFYSTPTCYLKAVKDASPSLPTKQDDFFPYASDPTAYWTGYFTSRPTTKYFERQGNGYLQMVKHLQVLMGLEAHNQFVIDELKSAMGVMQHHDAITGTEKQHVTHDYERILDAAIEDAGIVAKQAFNKMVEPSTRRAQTYDYRRCRFNESSCHTTETSAKFVVTIYNPVAWLVQEPVRIPVVFGKYKVVAPNGEKIDSQLMEISESVRGIPTRSSNATHELVFMAHLHPLGVKSFYVDAEGADDVMADEPMVVERYHDSYIENGPIQVRMNNDTGELTHLMRGDAVTELRLEYGYWTGCVGNNQNTSQRSSGAYIFRPQTGRPYPVRSKITQVTKGPVVSELKIESDHNVGSALRLYTGQPYLEHQFVVGPIDVSDDVGKEFIVKYKTNVINNGIFFTDSNGRQVLKRKLNERPQFNVTVEEPVAGNYYPVTNEIFIENDDLRVVVMTDRAQGGSSLEEGSLELMLHRRLLHDDAFGVGEALNETLNGVGLVMTGRHRIQIHDRGENSILNERKLILQSHLSPIIYVADAGAIGLNEWLTFNNCFKPAKELPVGLHLLTLESWGDGRVLIRFENYKDRGDGSIIEVDLSDVFTNLRIKSIKETTLAANRWLTDYEKWVWRSDDFTANFNDDYNNFSARVMATDDEDVSDDGMKIKLRGKQIKTFIAEYDLVDKTG